MATSPTTPPAPSSSSAPRSASPSWCWAACTSSTWACWSNSATPSCSARLHLGRSRKARGYQPRRSRIFRSGGRLTMTDQQESPSANKPPLRWGFFSVVLALGITAAVGEVLIRHDLSDSAALYIGIPLILALLLSLMPKSTSALGATMKGITIALLL